MRRRRRKRGGTKWAGQGYSASRRRYQRPMSLVAWAVVALLLAAFLLPNALLVRYLNSLEHGSSYALAQALVVLVLAFFPLLFFRIRGWLCLNGILLLLLPIELTSWLWVGEPLNYAVYSTIRHTTLSEAWGQLQGYMLPLGAYLGGLVCYFVLLVLFVPRGYRVRPFHWRRGGFSLLAVLLLSPFIVTHRPDEGAGWWHYWDRQYFPTLKGLFNGTYPLDILRHTIAYQKASAAEEAVLNLRQLPPFDDLAIAEQAPMLGVVVIGETSRACNWQLGGYARPTTPRLAHRIGVHYFADACAGANYTRLAAPILISSSTPSDPEAWRTAPFITEILTELGVRTGWVASQSTQNPWSRVAMTACSYVKTIDFSFPHSIPLDEKLLPHVREFIDSTQGHGLLVVHTYGGHFNYRDRYTRPYAYFAPELGESVSEMMQVKASDREHLLNSFDNTIAYTDMVLDSIVHYLLRRGGHSFMLYTADHGENLFDEPGVGHLHASAVPTHYEAHVPYLVWLSEGYRTHHPWRDSVLASHRQLPIDHTATFHTLLDLMGVSYAGKDATSSLVDSTYTPRERMVLNPSGQAFPEPLFPPCCAAQRAAQR